MATQLGLTEDQKAEVEKFRADVVEPSMSQLVILDFWAEWCGPCKQLTPLLEKVAADYADKGVVLKKVNVDEDKFIASQFQIKSIPTVYAMFQGKPVADLGEARTEGALKQMLDQILAQLPVQGESQQQQAEIEPLIEMGEQVLSEGDGERALSVFGQIMEMAPTEPKVLSGFVRALVMIGKIDEAKEMLAQIPEDVAKDPAIARAQSAIDLIGDAPAGEDTAPLAAKVEANPGDHEARLELATALMANDARDEAAEHLFHIIEADKDWNEGAARQKLLQLFEVVGLEDEWVSEQRRRLSAILFG
ncbi:putative thioredoxin [Parasphingopyxis lamellibrachiae]|uniref:Putative thioredoxin n=1 Tax=Parasphingopyxis lamellibrachiae TaxID=680125 RepID=A0A3D9FGZ7_9SPHN|nr:tetratricopeptide repeat protein [Parasphingopyxis lamellibrachiae]RED17065.1 putative thioredoxin [Parasphingopyxis lamellibrachiae]